MGPLLVRVLGPVTVESAAADVVLRPQSRAVLAILLAHRGLLVSADYLLDAVWEGTPSRSARTQLHGHISQLRRSMCRESVQIVTQSHGYMLSCSPDATDMERFRVAAGHGRELLEQGDADHAITEIRCALALWRGPAFADVSVAALRALVEELEERRLQAVEDAGEAAIACDHHALAVADLTPMVRRWPFRERARALLMTALARSGRTADALRLYQEGRRLLIAELGLEPSQALQRVHRGVLTGEAGYRPSVRALTGGVSG